MKKPIDHRREFIRGVEALSHRHPRHRVFADLMEAYAISLSNAVDLNQRDAREERYMQLIAAYEEDEVRKMPATLGALVEAMEHEGEPRDLLGEIFHELDLQNHWKGQFFTPDAVSQLIARMLSSPDDLRQHIARRGFLPILEPTCGAGSMILAKAQAMRQDGFNPQRELHATGVDIDIRCVHMAYVQCSLWNIPAVIHHGNSLTGEVWSSWFTPAHVMGLWNYKLRRANHPMWHELSPEQRLKLCLDHDIPVDQAHEDELPDALQGLPLPAL